MRKSKFSTHKSHSRRKFLALTGAVVATGAAAHALPALAQANPTIPASQTEDIRTALNLAVTSPMFKEVAEQLQASGFKLTTVAQDLIPTVSKTLDDLIGLALHCEGEVTPRNQADVILTVDMRRKELTGLQVIKGWSWFDTLFVTGTNFDARWPLYEEIRPARIVYEDPPKLIRPQREQSWVFDRASVESSKDIQVEEGWPPESESDCFWHFDGCVDIAYEATEYIAAFRCIALRESNRCAPSITQTIKSSY